MDSSLSNDMDLSKLKVPDLRKELKNRGLSTAGNKNELLERLQSAMKSDKSEDANETASVDDLEEDLLNEEDDESHIEENDSVLQDFDSALDKSPGEPKPAQGIKRKSDEGLATNGTAVKKIILNRSSITEDLDEKTNGTETANTSQEPKEKKVIKLSELSAKERLEMRAKKFGTPLSGDAKKEVRAERFGINKPATKTTTVTGKAKTTSTPIAAAAAASADVLKQRAERFGVKTSTTLTKLENQEKLDKRKERFGAITTSKTATNGAATALSKAQQRLERFKQPVK